MTEDECNELIAYHEKHGWKCDINTPEKVSFTFPGDMFQEWVKDYDKKTNTFVQFNTKQKVNIKV